MNIHMFGSIALCSVMLLACNQRAVMNDQNQSSALVVSSARSFAYGPGNYDFTIDHGGKERVYSVHVPASYDTKTPVSMVMAFHGGGGTARQAERSFGLNAVSDREGFIVVYPQGVDSIVGGGTWNAGKCCGEAMNDNVDDIGFIEVIIDQLENDFAIDPKRIYATGHSNGAMFSYRLACELSDKIAAIAPVGGHDAEEYNCDLSRPVPVMHFHGSADKCSNYAGGQQCGGCFNDVLREAGIPVGEGYTWQCPAVPNYMATWGERNGCSEQSTILKRSGSTVCRQYTGCDADTILCTIQGMGHTWPGDTSLPQACVNNPNGRACKAWNDIIGPPSGDINAAEEMWSFFEQHRLE